MAPDPIFAAHLRDRVVQISTATTQERPSMPTHISDRQRNGFRHGDVSYVTLGVPDIDRARAFYGSVLGWSFNPGGHGALSGQVDAVVPMIGLRGGKGPTSGRSPGAVLSFRVDDIAAVVTAVRAHGGVMSDPHQEPYALAAEGHDDQGLAFYLHQMPSDQAAISADDEPWNGEMEGDVSYLTMVVPDLDVARAFYGDVLGWTFNIGQAGGGQVTGVAPQIGLTTSLASGLTDPGVVLCYRVNEMPAAIERVRAAGGRANESAVRPYGLESFCEDDQGIPFYLHQL
jgi:predicted enzyme related to lactoylglutathione lyase